ncbi:MAG: hypothetical protein KKG33_11390, partial [candidate division Zixibacteria bacterium]|nr:hypothetical protein [candidate division Zixibacteria bacterium]
GKLTPTSYRLLTSATPPFPTICIDTAVSVEIRARLLDPATGDEIAREAKTLSFKFTPRKARVFMSDISNQTLPIQGLRGRDLRSRFTGKVSGSPHFVRTCSSLCSIRQGS